MQPEGKPFGNGEGNLPDGINVRGSGGWQWHRVPSLGKGVAELKSIRRWQTLQGENYSFCLPWLASIISRQRRRTDSGPSTGETSDSAVRLGRGALRNIADRLASLSHTGRNNACFSAACKLGQMIARGWIGYERSGGA